MKLLKDEGASINFFKYRVQVDDSGMTVGKDSLKAILETPDAQLDTIQIRTNALDDNGEMIYSKDYLRDRNTGELFKVVHLEDGMFIIDSFGIKIPLSAFIDNNNIERAKRFSEELAFEKRLKQAIII